jgi:hypothetical protein
MWSPSGRQGSLQRRPTRARCGRAFASTPYDETPANEFRLGFDGQGRLLELQVLIFDSGDELVIYAMKARKQYLGLLDASPME